VLSFSDVNGSAAPILNQVAAMAVEQLDGDVVVGPGRFEQTEAMRSGAPDVGQIGVVGLVARNPKQIQSTKKQVQEVYRQVWSICRWDFGFVSDFVIRNSDFKPSENRVETEG
jgi:hypothetical protein